MCVTSFLMSTYVRKWSSKPSQCLQHVAGGQLPPVAVSVPRLRQSTLNRRNEAQTNSKPLQGIVRVQQATIKVARSTWCATKLQPSLHNCCSNIYYGTPCVFSADFQELVKLHYTGARSQKTSFSAPFSSAVGRLLISVYVCVCMCVCVYVCVCVCVLRVCATCVCVKHKVSQKNHIFWGSMAENFDQCGCTLRGRCLHIELCCDIWCGEYRSAVRVSTRNTNSQIYLVPSQVCRPTGLVMKDATLGNCIAEQNCGRISAFCT
jgi:hypothetical protein